LTDPLSTEFDVEVASIGSSEVLASLKVMKSVSTSIETAKEPHSWASTCMVVEDEVHLNPPRGGGSREGDVSLPSVSGYIAFTSAIRM
jgi:hypothetical protein